MKHHYYLKRCLQLARLGTGLVSPNPLVGAVIVKEDAILAEGYHSHYGGIHAEVDALNKIPLSTDLKNATLYCNLEPCSFESPDKKNPPCVKAILERGIKYVVFCAIDKNPLVKGEGLKQLQAAGVTVEYNFLEEEAIDINKFYYHAITKQKPYVTLKMAQTIDGRSALANGESQWISNELSRRYVHEKRSEYDAILLGVDTVNADNPKLTVRHAAGRNPKRLIIDSKNRINATVDLLNDEFVNNTYLFGTAKTNPHTQVKYLKTKEKNDHVDLNDLLNLCYKEKITSIYAEAGANLSSILLTENLVNEIHCFIAPKFFGAEARESVANLNINKMSEALLFRLDHVEKFDSDILVVYKKI